MCGRAGGRMARREVANHQKKEKKSNLSEGCCCSVAGNSTKSDLSEGKPGGRKEHILYCSLVSLGYNSVKA